jgi:hypothetical protein
MADAEAFLQLAGGLERPMAACKHFWFDAQDLPWRFRGLKVPERSQKAHGCFAPLGGRMRPLKELRFMSVIRVAKAHAST